MVCAFFLKNGTKSISKDTAVQLAFNRRMGYRAVVTNYKLI